MPLLRRAAHLGALLLALGGRAAAAETPMTAAEFEAYTTGRTLIYGTGGVAYGIEEYRPGRRVVWSFLDEDCVEGVWYPQDEAICFAYEGREEPQCWVFFRDAEGLSAITVDDPDGTRLYEIRQSSEPMICRGPRVGV